MIETPSFFRNKSTTFSFISFLNVQPPNVLFHFPDKFLSPLAIPLVALPFRIKYFSFVL